MSSNKVLLIWSKNQFDTDMFHIYDDTTDKWYLFPHLEHLTQHFCHPLALVGRKLYQLYEPGSQWSSLEILDLKLGRYERTFSLIPTRACSAAVVDERYIFTGYNHEIYRIDTLENTWMKMSTEFRTRNYCSATTWDALVGCEGNVFGLRQDSVEKYFVKDNVSIRLYDFPDFGPKFFANAVGDRIYICNEYDPNRVNDNNLVVFSPTEYRWYISEPQILAPVKICDVIEHNGQLVAVDHTEPSLYVYDVEKIRWKYLVRRCYDRIHKFVKIYSVTREIMNL